MLGSAGDADGVQSVCCLVRVDGSVAVAVSYGAVEQAMQRIRVCVSCLVVKTWRREWLLVFVHVGTTTCRVL